MIRDQYQYREFTWPGSFRLSRLLYTRSWISNERPSLLFDLATGWLIQHKILLPGASTLTRLISEIRERATNRLWLRLSALPTQEQAAKLETLLQVPEGSRTSRFDRFRKGPVTISGPAFNEAVDRYLGLKAFGMRELKFYRHTAGALQKPRSPCRYDFHAQDRPHARKQTHRYPGGVR